MSPLSPHTNQVARSLKGMDFPEPDVTLDCIGAICPVPINLTARRVEKMSRGEILAVMGDDPGLQIDIPAWCISQRNIFLGLEFREGITVCYLEVGPGENGSR